MNNLNDAGIKDPQQPQSASAPPQTPAPTHGHAGGHHEADAGLLGHLLGHDGLGLTGYAGLLGLDERDGLFGVLSGHGGHHDLLDVSAHIGIDVFDCHHGW